VGDLVNHAVVGEYCAKLSRAVHYNNEEAANFPMEIRCEVSHLFWNYKRFKTQVNCLNFNNVGDVGISRKSQRKDVGDVG